MIDREKKAVIMVNGSGYSKIGLSGEDAPRSVFPTIIGRPKNPGIMIGMDAKDKFFGDEARAKRGILRLKYPIEHGIIRNWNDMEQIWHNSFFRELHVEPEEHPVFLTESPGNSMKDREKMTSIMFETFNVPAFYVATREVLSLYESGKLTGLVLNVGDGVTHCLPVFSGYHIKHSLGRMGMAGRDCSDYLMKIMSERGYEMTGGCERGFLKGMKEKHCYVSLDFEEELRQDEIDGHSEYQYELIDGSKLTIGNERYRCPEILFQPRMIGSRYRGIQHLIVDVLRESEEDLQNLLLEGGICVSGGGTLFKNFEERLEKEVKNVIRKKYFPTESKKRECLKKIKIIAPKNRQFTSWIGASVLTSLGTWRKMWITKDEYDDHGGTIVHRKCL